MADIHIHREHRLGLAAARRTAERWAEEAERSFGLSCTIVEHDDHDVVEFERSGVRGALRVEADAFDLVCKLGLLAGAFRSRIEGEIEKNLDAALAAAASASPSTPATKRKRKPATS